MTTVELTVLEAGSCEQLEHFVLRTRSTRKLRFPALYAMIRHPRHGVVLFDAGYSRHVLELCESWPERAYVLTLPVSLPEEDDPVHKLRSLGVAPEDVGHIFLSHFHIDHVGALRDFPRAQFVYRDTAWLAVRGLGRVAGLKRAFMGGLIPDDFEDRGRPFGASDYRPLADTYSPFESGFDVFGDGSLIAVDLPGHATGQVGLFVQTGDETVFLSADACWTTRSYADNVLPARIAGAVFDSWDDYRTSLSRLHRFHELHPEIPILPSHCQQAWDAWRSRR